MFCGYHEHQGPSETLDMAFLLPARASQLEADLDQAHMAHLHVFCRFFGGRDMGFCWEKMVNPLIKVTQKNR